MGAWTFAIVALIVISFKRMKVRTHVLKLARRNSRPGAAFTEDVLFVIRHSVKGVV